MTTVDPAFRRDVYKDVYATLELNRTTGFGDITAYLKRDEDALRRLEDLDREAGPGLRVNRLVRFQVGDGHALYLVAKVGARTCTLLHIPAGDAYRSPAVDQEGKCSTTTVRQYVAWDDELRLREQAEHQQREAAARRLVPGSHVYFRGMNGWLRGVVTPGREIKCEALLGYRHDHSIRAPQPSAYLPQDVYTVARTGEVHYDYDARKVREGAICTPRPEDVWGTPGYRPRNPHDDTDPSALPVLPHEPPPFTPQQLREQELWRVLESIVLVLEPHSYNGRLQDPAIDPDPLSRMRHAHDLLGKVLEHQQTDG